MKKYVKPQVILERYELSHTIAACGWNLTLSSEESCVAVPGPSVSMPGITLFTETPRCGLDSEDYEGYCYQNGANGLFGLFNS